MKDKTANLNISVVGFDLLKLKFIATLFLLEIMPLELAYPLSTVKCFRFSFLNNIISPKLVNLLELLLEIECLFFFKGKKNCFSQKNK